MTATINDEPLQRVMRFLGELRHLHSTVGLQGAEGGRTHPLADVPVAQVGAWGEFGTIHAPARPFMRSSIIEGERSLAQGFADAIARGIERAAKGEEPAEAVMLDGGLVAAKLMKERIQSSPGWAEPNAELTKRNKGHDQPLLGGDPRKGVAPGTMHDAISAAVRREGAIVRGGKP